MSRSELLQELAATYKKFGWNLRRVLLTEDARCEIGDALNTINAEAEISDINAIWFSRLSGNREAWELRLLSASPFALIETFDKDSTDAERAETLKNMEEKLRINTPKFSV